MLVTFKSRAAGDVLMFGDVAKRVLALIGKDGSAPGIVTVEQLPATIAALREAVEAAKAADAAAPADRERQQEEAGTVDRHETVSLARRIPPLLEQMQYSLAEETPVVWEISGR